MQRYLLIAVISIGGLGLALWLPLNFDPWIAMQRYLLIAVISIGGLGLALWLMTEILVGIVNLASADWRQRRAALANQKKLEKFRRQHPAQIVGVPDLAALSNTVTVLKGFVANADAYRRQKFTPSFDTKFRAVCFSFPFESFFPRDCEDSGDGPHPEPWAATLDSLVVPRGRDLRSIYKGVISMQDFPCTAPGLGFDPGAPPEYPPISLPPWDIKIVAADTGGEINFRVDMLQKVYATEIAQAENLRRMADDFKELRRRAEEAKHLMDTHIANERLAYREALTKEFNSCKQNWEQQYDEQLGPIRSIHQEYKVHTTDGIENHFQFALRTLPLPLPSAFPWRTFYNANERLLQVNQRVPFLPDIVVKRADSKRAPSKKDTDNFLRRLVPAVSLHIAQHVALNDLYDDVDTIAVNGWCRYFERTTGQLKNAFVSSLKVEKKDILQIDINKADALDAFRGLRGVYVYSTEETVPIEPQIRLDKKDDRFVEGKEVLEGMAQGQNLATMDWQDFEHLIRELLAKEYGRKEGSEVRITRASRDRGVDAVIFDPDPLHGGKYVVQAKRYNNVVDVSAGRDLWGTVLNEGAARGILVTTSRYGRDAYDFVSNKPLTLVDGQNLLALLAKHGFKFKIELE
jgi:Restriction endonuclease